MSALRRLVAGRTTLVIAHRLSTVRDADRIVVLERGVVAEQGTHGQLMERGGIYARLYRTQMGESDRPQGAAAPDDSARTAPHVEMAKP